ncbi:MAG TPA: YeeE/YedE thiosulfate transporter family protein [Opitutaceae bacterium]|nr:YeeE/YedE thiosulfate transporter family protein [Opitutaceae bacterium]
MPDLNHAFVRALAGGVLIGLASLLVLLATGKIAGISGMLSRMLRPRSGDTAWRLVFLVGLVAGAALAFSWIESAAVYRPVRSLAAIGVAGLLVGFGTRVGGGCTSGHGVSGIGQGSKSSFVATLVFVLAGMATVFVLHHTRWGVAP